MQFFGQGDNSIKRSKARQGYTPDNRVILDAISSPAGPDLCAKFFAFLPKVSDIAP